MSFGDKIKKLRRGRNMTQDQLANLLNVTPQAISRWENNSAMPDISLLVPLAHVFRVSTDELLEVNVERMEQEIGAVIEKAADFENTDEVGASLDSKIAFLRDSVRNFPEDNRLKSLLIGFLAGNLIRNAPCQDPAIFREQASLYEDMLETGGTPDQQADWKANLVSLYREMGMTERISDLVKDAPEMKISREMMRPEMLRGRERIEARKELVFKCIDAIILSLFAMMKEDAEALTEKEWAALEGATRVVETVYGKDLADHFVLTDELYGVAYAHWKCGKKEKAIEKLADIVRRLQLMETTGSEKPALLSDNEFKRLCGTGCLQSVRMKARFILTRLERDWDLSEQKESDPLWRDMYQELKRLTETENDSFQDWCTHTFVELMK